MSICLSFLHVIDFFLIQTSQETRQDFIKPLPTLIVLSDPSRIYSFTSSSSVPFHFHLPFTFTVFHCIFHPYIFFFYFFIFSPLPPSHLHTPPHEAVSSRDERSLWILQWILVGKLFELFLMGGLTRQDEQEPYNHHSHLRLGLKILDTVDKKTIQLKLKSISCVYFKFWSVLALFK